MAQSIPASSVPAFGGRKVLIAALILGAITAGLIVAFLASQDDSPGSVAGGTTVSVVVAKQDIPVGTKIERSMVEVREVPANAAISGAIEDLGDVVDETARYSMVPGEQFTLQRLVEPPKVKSASFSIPKGMRGFTVPVEGTRSPAALMVPGDFVDVIVSAEITTLLLPDGTSIGAPKLDDNEKPKAAVTLLQNIQVLSVQRAFVDNGVVYDESTRGEPGDQDKGVNNVTLLVTPEQAQLLWLAIQEGKITLALRAFGDAEAPELHAIAEPIRLP